MSASRLLQLLEQSGMLEKSLLTELRKQVAESKYKVSAESVAKILVDKGHLTKFQATKLVGQATEEEEAAERAKGPRTRSTDPAPAKANPPEEEELGLAPEDAAELGISPSRSSVERWSALRRGNLPQECPSGRRCCPAGRCRECR